MSFSVKALWPYHIGTNISKFVQWRLIIQVCSVSIRPLRHGWRTF